MRRARQIYSLFFFLITCSALQAQRVLYAPPLKGGQVFHFVVAGKSGNNYWVHKQQRKRRIDEESFDIYNNRLELISSIPAATVNAYTLKKYLLCSTRYFDELVLSAANHETSVQLRRYENDGRLLNDSVIARFPFQETGNGFILAVSADKSKKLILGFESIAGSAPKLHAMLFDAGWKTISYLVYEQPFLTQPFIQDDFFCYPSASNNAPVQLANNGEWLMAAPSRSSNNFLLLHFDGATANITYKEILQPASYKMEDIALSVNNEKGEAFAGILSRGRQSVHKNVHVTHYSFSGDAFDFDADYNFSTLPAPLAKENNLVKENFIAVPDMGFMLLKEYGRPFNSWYAINEEKADNMVSNVAAHFTINANGYSRFGNSWAPGDAYSRGDLSLFYFPGRSADSCWSGFINKKQITELNAPNLSYLFVPLADRLVLMYNSADRDEDPYGNTLSLDPQGNPISERELIAWKADQSLLFQQAVVIASNEVAVPYERNQQKGFVIIRF